MSPKRQSTTPKRSSTAGSWHLFSLLFTIVRRHRGFSYSLSPARQPWLRDSHSSSVALPPADRLNTYRCHICSIWGHRFKSNKSFSLLHQKHSILNKSRSTDKLVILNKLLCCSSKYNFSPSFSLCTVLCYPS